VSGRKHGRGLFSGVLLLLLIAGAAQAYEPGHGALNEWNNEARANIPPYLMAWLGLLSLTFLASIFFVWHHIEARWVLGSFIASHVVTAAIDTQTDIVVLAGLVGLIHFVCWLPALLVLLARSPFLSQRSAFGVWSAAITIVILISFYFDVRDAGIYLDHVLELGLL